MATKLQEEKQKKLLELMKLANDGLTKQEFIGAFNRVVDLIKRVVAENKLHRAELEKSVEKQGSKLSLEASKKLDLTQSTIKKSLETALSQQEQSLNFIRDKVRKIKEGKDGKDGLDADENRIIEELTKRLPELPEFEIPQEVIDALEQDYNEIKRLKKEIKELRESKKLGGGGGTSQASLKYAFGKMLQTETPSGDIDGANKTYTTASQINAVMSFGINGMVIHPSEYSTAKNTITFTTAIPAALSGTTFEITYV